MIVGWQVLPDQLAAVIWSHCQPFCPIWEFCLVNKPNLAKRLSNFVFLCQKLDNPYYHILTVKLKPKNFTTSGMTRILAFCADNCITCDSWLELLSRNVTALVLQHQVCKKFLWFYYFGTGTNREMVGLSVLLTVTLKSTFFSTFGMTRILAFWGEHSIKCDSWLGCYQETLLNLCYSIKHAKHILGLEKTVKWWDSLYYLQ